MNVIVTSWDDLEGAKDAPSYTCALLLDYFVFVRRFTKRAHDRQPSLDTHGSGVFAMDAGSHIDET